MSRGEHPRRRRSDSAPPPKGILAGERELIFQYLPEEVRANMLRRGSESAALWNAFYPFAHSGLSLRAWLSLPRLWGSSAEGSDDDQLMPCFWGLTVDGQPLGGLAESASDVAGREDRLEIDLFLVGRRHLVAVEAKIDGVPGRCGRYDSGRCPEVHGPDAACRAADVVLPIANVAEEDGTFVNRDGREQRYFQAKPAPGMARPAAWVLGELAAALGVAEVA